MFTPMVYAHGKGMSDCARPARQRLVAETEGTGWDVGHAVEFLLCDHARYITGQVLVVDGGVTLQGPERELPEIVDHGSATLAINSSFVRTIISHAAVVHGTEVSALPSRLRNAKACGLDCRCSRRPLHHREADRDNQTLDVPVVADTEGLWLS